jgi:hypothetical protein
MLLVRTCDRGQIVRTFISVTGKFRPKALRRVWPWSPSNASLWVLGSTLLLYVALRCVLGFAHQLTVAAFAWLLHTLVVSGVWEPLVRSLGVDPIYAGAAIRAAGGVQVDGFAIAGPLGALLHQVLPAIFLAPGQVVDGAWASMVAAPGAPAIGRGLASFGADVAWLTVGMWLFVRWRQRSLPIALLGLLLQAQIGVNHLLHARLSLQDLDASGLPFALQVAVPGGGWFTGGLAAWSADVRGIVLGLVLLVLGYAGAGVVLGVIALVGRLPWRAVRLPRRTPPQPVPVTPVRRRAGQIRSAPIGLVGVVVAVVAAWSPIGALAVGGSNWQSAAPEMRSLATTPRPTSRHTLRVSGATPVQVVQQPDGTWEYDVDGTPEIIHGVGYNPWYASLSTDQRTALYDRDFSAMHQSGINTIEGWFETQFDSVTLDAAERNGIGVLMPFELNQDWDYTDPTVRAGILDRVSAYVEKYRDHPAVRMWAPGNENLHRVLYAHWVSQANDPTARARAQAFASFLPQLVDRIHELDPNHPVVYRDAEDLYLPWITGAFQQAGGDRPWLVYGANVYSTPRLQQIVASWPSQWPGRPLLISEFAPGGAGPTQRPIGLQQDWQTIRSRPGVVLGGLAYTWATNGPEDLDRVFGFVDPNGTPTDGGLAALSTAYLTDGGPTTAQAAPNN